jgi:small-conductance mechanosensitive channel
VSGNTTYINTPLGPIDLERILSYLGIAAGIAVTIVIAVLVRYGMRKGLGPRMPIHVYQPLEKVVFYSIIVLGVIASLSPLGLSLTGLLVTGGIVGIIIGFAAQTTISNFLAGILLFIDRPFKVGDPVSIGSVSGVVTEISLLSTKVRTWDGYVVRMPNQDVFTSTISNYSRNVARRIVIQVGIAYGSDIEKAKEVIIKALEEHPYVLVTPAPDVYVDSFGDSAIVLNVRAWAPNKVWFATRMQLPDIVKKALDEAGIEIPFPQLDVYIKRMSRPS